MTKTLATWSTGHGATLDHRGSQQKWLSETWPGYGCVDVRGLELPFSYNVLQRWTTSFAANYNLSKTTFTSPRFSTPTVPPKAISYLQSKSTSSLPTSSITPSFPQSPAQQVLQDG